MLIQFNFENFKSFKNEATLDMSATNLKTNTNHVINNGTEKILPFAAIFGENAGGKSNVLNAFEYMTNYVITSAMFKESQETTDSYPMGIPKFERAMPFMFDDESKEKESTFEVFFMLNNDEKKKVYQYGFCVDKDGISEEWLNTKAKTSKNYKTIFYRDREELDLSGILKKHRENIAVSLREKTLVVSLGEVLNIDILKNVVDWFSDNRIVNLGDPIESFLMSIQLPDDFYTSQEVRENVVDYIHSFDNSITDFEVEKIDDKYKVYTIHKNNSSGERVRMPLNSESAGTLKMFSLYKYLNKVMKTGGTFIIDELNSKLHPLLIRNLMLTFLNPEINNKNAQLIFTTHDPWTLSNDILRRDEIWFVEKDSFNSSSLYSLAEFKTEDGLKIRVDENYEKNYLLGKYGAIPTLSKIKISRGDYNGEK